MAAVAAGAAGSWWSRSSSDQKPGIDSGSGPGARDGSAGVASGPNLLGEDFWALSLPRPDEQLLSMKSFKGRPLLVNFWATWCPPCVREMPLLDEFYKQMKPSGMEMVGVAVDSPTPVRGFLGKTPVGFPVVLAGADGAGLARTLGNSLGGLPYTVMADAHGRVVARQMGELMPAQLADWARIIKSAG
jgi:thiol-disulfide isomerase/thioredoxin